MNVLPSIGESLARMVANGLCTLEDLDRPSKGWEGTERDRQLSKDPCDFSSPVEKVPFTSGEGPTYYSFPRPTITYPDRPPYRNLAREWIAANPQKWRQLVDPDNLSEAVLISDPRDFTPAPGHTPALDPPAPLSQPSDDHRPPAPTQPVSVTDDPVDPRGITVYTNADDPDLWF